MKRRAIAYILSGLCQEVVWVMTMNVFLWVAVALFAGLMFTRVFKVLHLNFPDVTAFLIAGLLIGPFALGRLGLPGVGFHSFEELSHVSLMNDAALGFSALSRLPSGVNSDSPN